VTRMWRIRFWICLVQNVLVELRNNGQEMRSDLKKKSVWKRILKQVLRQAQRLRKYYYCLTVRVLFAIFTTMYCLLSL